LGGGARVGGGGGREGVCCFDGARMWQRTLKRSKKKSDIRQSVMQWGLKIRKKGMQRMRKPIELGMRRFAEIFLLKARVDGSRMKCTIGGTDIEKKKRHGNGVLEKHNGQSWGGVQIRRFGNRKK